MKRTRRSRSRRPGIESLESRAMLAADDIVVSLVGNRVSLALDPAGVAIASFGTSYDAASGVLTITALTAGRISTLSPIAGLSIDGAADTIDVNLKALPRFAGVSVVGGAGTDSITIARGGVNLAAVSRGAAAQGLSIDTGAGTGDTIAVAGPILTKGAGGLQLTTQGAAAMHGILLSAGTRAPAGTQTFAGAVTLLRDVAIRAGRDITFSSTVDGPSRLHLAAGRAITLAGDVGGRLPLQGVTLATAGRVAVGRAFALDGSGTAAGTHGLVVGSRVHNVVFSALAATRTISGFSGAGIRFLGGSQGSRIVGVTSSDNGIGLQLGPGSYTRTVIAGSAFTGNAAAGVALAAVQGVTIGGLAAGAGNSIVSNGGFGLTATGACTGSFVAGNEIGGNTLGQVENLLASRLTGTTVTHNATGLRLHLTDVGRASYLAQKSRGYSFDVTFRAFSVVARSTGRLDPRTATFEVDVAVGLDAVPPATVASAVEPGDITPNRVVAGMTPPKVLRGFEFPKSTIFLGSDTIGRHSRAVVGLSALVGMLPLADLASPPLDVRADSPVTIDVWLDAQGSVSRVEGSFAGGSFEVAIRGPGTTAPAAAAAPFGLVSAAPSSLAATAAAPLLPGAINGVGGVVTGHSTLSIPYGTGYEAAVDWYFPTQIDETVAAQGVLWLQHGLGAIGNAYAALARHLARETNSIVIAATLPATAPTEGTGWWHADDPMRQAVAALFAGDRAALHASARAAGYSEDRGPLPGRVVLAGHSAGGGFATAVAAELAAADPAAADVAGVVMFDGVSAGAYDGSGRFAQQLAALDDRGIPVFQIAAPAQLWNAYGATTNALLAARANRFAGVVLAGGSHVDALLGGDPGIDFVAQGVTKASPSGNAAAIRTLSAGWINDLYSGFTPAAPTYGFYAAANQPIILGAASAAALPSPLANVLSAGDRRLDAEIAALGGLSGFLPAPVTNDGPNGLSAAAVPPGANGVTGVRTGTAALDIPCGPDGYATTADWYFPTQSDGRVAANAVIWLQHGDDGSGASLAAIATGIARQTNSIVLAPTILTLETPALPGRFLGGAALGEAVAGMFTGDRGALGVSAAAAGHQGPLPQGFVLAGHGLGGGFAVEAAAGTVDNGAATNLLGVVMLDGAAGPEQFAQAVAKLDSLGIPVYQIAAPAQIANAWGRTAEQLVALHPDQFVGVQIEDVSQADLVRGTPQATPGGAESVGPSPEDVQDAVITLVAGWINDIYAGCGPTNPFFGIYGNPNDGSYVPAQPIFLGRIRAVTLPASSPV